MIEAWGGILNLVLYALNMLGLGYYAYLTVFNPNTLVNRYDLGEKAVPIIRIVGSFVLPTVLLGVYVIFREGGPLGLWIFFVFNFLVVFCQVLLSWGTRLKIIDPDSKTDVSDEVIGHVFLAISIILIFRLSDTIYA
ncbi:hypothetical protein OAQ96_01615 [Alphaproteobacteria bacterium]|nr:hypothetical protein [Alphaproteobacteria bacterium]